MKWWQNPAYYPCRCENCYLFPDGGHYCKIYKKHAYRVEHIGCEHQTGTHGHVMHLDDILSCKDSFFGDFTAEKEIKGVEVKKISVKQLKEETKKKQQGSLW